MERRYAGEATVAGVNGDLFSFTRRSPDRWSHSRRHPRPRPRRLPLHDRRRHGRSAARRPRPARRELAGLGPTSGHGVERAAAREPREPVHERMGPAHAGRERGRPGDSPAGREQAEHAADGNRRRLCQRRQPAAFTRDGAVLVARGAQAPFLAAEAPVGAKVTILLALTPPWANVQEALGGGPIIVRTASPYSARSKASRPTSFRSAIPRTGVGQLADGRIVLVAVDGRQPGYSTGLTNFELALAMMRLGCVTASALDAGGSTTMAFDGKLLNRPSDPGGERAVAEALHTLLLRCLRAGAAGPRALAERRPCRRHADARVQDRSAFDRHGEPHGPERSSR